MDLTTTYKAGLNLRRKANSAKIKLTLRQLCHRRRLLSKRLPQPVNASLDVLIPWKLLLSEMKITLMVRLDLGHILWSGGVVRVERAHRIGVVRGVQKMLDVGGHGMIDFGHVGVVVRDGVVTYVCREHEFVGCCIAQHHARDIDIV